MQMLVRALVLPSIAVTAAVAAVPAGRDAVVKCGSSSRVHHVVDGRFLDAQPIEEIEMPPREDVHEIAIFCWDPVQRVLQLGAGEPVVYVITKQFMGGLHDDLRRLVAAQDAFRGLHGRFTDRLADLEVDLGILPEDASITLGTTADGWHATASSPLLTFRCHVFAGTMPPESAVEPESLVERTPACFALPQFRR